MFYYFLPYSVIYLILYFCRNSWIDKERKRYLWDSFTRIMSTINSLLCIYMVCLETPNIISMYNLEYNVKDSNNYFLYLFVYYLLIDGMFDIMYNWTESFEKFKKSDVLGTIHHFLGAYGIYLIASTKLGFFLGMYFAFTEISTPLLNLSWFVRTENTFAYFSISFFISRILSIPLLLYYLSLNANKLSALPLVQYLMSYYASYTLILLNIIWFSYIFKKTSLYFHKRLLKYETYSKLILQFQ